MGTVIGEENDIARVVGEKPFVLFGNGGDALNWVDVDNYLGGRLITEYMLGKYRKICYIGVSQKKLYAKQRYQAFTDCVEEASRNKDILDVEMTDNKEWCGYDACNALLQRVKPDAIICASDLLAIGCIRALEKSDIRVPAQIAVSGFDGLGYETLIYPHITTVRQPVYEAGLKLADVMLDKLSGNNTTEGVYIKPFLVVHESA
jgi:DNA-binding LacI/PurR family transcriptional regulator